MYARVIPALRTPRHVACFDYAVPEGITVARGDLVHAPFRASTITGLVASVSATPSTDKPLKPISGQIAELRFTATTVTLLERLATRAFVSPPSVLHAWIGTLPKRVGQGAIPIRQQGMLAHVESRLLRDHLRAPHGVIDTAKYAIDEGKRVLVITPWATRAAWLANECSATLLTSDLATGARFKAWSGFIRGAISCIVTTRVGAWLATEADLVILDEPENDDHKQDELAPRYDARWMTEEAYRLGTSAISIGLTPRLSAPIKQVPTIDASVTAVDMSHKDWSSIAALQQRTLTGLEDALEDQRACFIIHPIHGERASLRCADCGWSPTCRRCGSSLTLQSGALTCKRCQLNDEVAASCPSCGGTNLSKARPGRERLAKDLSSHQLNVRVLSLKEWHDLDVLPERSHVVLTDLLLLSGGVEDIRRRERLIVAFRRLADRCASTNSTLTVQSDSQLLADAQTWLTEDGCRAANEREQSERKQFQLPPATRLVKLIVRGSESTAKGIRDRISGSVSGPYAVPFLTTTREPRWIVHLTVPKETMDDAIRQLLEPILNTDVLIDLDPIAFFE